MSEQNEDWFAPLKLEEEEEKIKVPEEYTEPKVSIEVSDPSLAEKYRKYYGSGVKDFFRTNAELGSTVASALIKDPINIAGEAMGLEEPVISDDVGVKARKALDFGLEQINLGDVIDEQGEVTPTETVVGPALTLGAYIAGGAALARTRVLATLPEAVRYTLAGLGTGQLFG
jgi:hypothetical protein